MTMVDALGWGVMHLAWQAMLVGGAWWLATRRAPAPVRYRAGLCALIALTAMFATTVSAFLIGSRAPDLASLTTAALEVFGAKPSESDLVARLAGFARIAGVCWIVGVLTLTARHVGGWRLARKACIEDAVDAREDWRSCAGEAASALGMSLPRVVECAGVDSPAVFGVRRPVIALPAHGLERLSRTQLRGVFAHELAHISRRDGLASLVQCVVDVVLFFHPVARMISRHVRTEREKLCDLRAADVCGDAATYVAGLVALEESRFRWGHFALAARGNGQLLDRARHMLLGDAGGASHVRLAIAAAMGALIVVAAPSLAWPVTGRAGALSRMPAEFTVSAVDPAGSFSLTVRHGRAVAGSLDGAVFPSDRIAQRRDSVFVLRPDGSRELALRITPRGGISWSPRKPTPSRYF